MKKLDLTKLPGNLKKYVAEYNQVHKIKFSKVFNDYAMDNLDHYDTSMIYRYLSGKRTPSTETLVVLATLLGVTLDELLS